MQSHFGAIDGAAMNAMRGTRGIGDGLRQVLHNSGSFRVEAIKSISAVESLTTAIKKQDLTLGGLAKQHRMLNEVVKEQQRLRRASTMAWTEDARGSISADMIIPRDVPGRVSSFTQTLNAARAGQIGFGQAMMDGRVKLGVYSEALKSAALNTVNWGKNMQWAGRQLSIGLTLPFVAFGAMVGKQATEVDKQMTKILKVYDFGPSITNASEQAAAAMEVQSASMATATDNAQRYGASITDTLGVVSDLASAGKTGTELQKTTNLVNRAALLGDMDRKKTLEATITLQNVYGHSVRQLGDDFNYMNQLENNTSLTMADMVDTIPKLAGIVKNFGGNLQDIGTLATAAKVAGVDVGEGANSVKAVLTRITTYEDKKPGKLFLDATGKSLKELRIQAKGDLITNLQLIGQALATIPDAHEKTSVANALFGQYQTSKGTSILEQVVNIKDAGSQMARAFDAAHMSTEEWAVTANRETKKVQESLGVRFQRVLQSLKTEFANMGRPFAEFGVTVLKVVESIVSGFNHLPGFIKKFTAIGLSLLALVGPVTMIVGLFGNLFGTVMKFGAGIGSIFARSKIVTMEQQAQQLLAEKGAAAFKNQADSAMILTDALAKMTEQLTIANVAQKGLAASSHIQPLLPAQVAAQETIRRNITVSSLVNGGADNVGMNNAMRKGQYLRVQADTLQQVNRGLMTEAQRSEILNKLAIELNDLLQFRNEIQTKVVLGQMDEAAGRQAIIQKEVELDQLGQLRAELQARMVTEKLSEVEVYRILVKEASVLAQVEERRVLQANLLAKARMGAGPNGNANGAIMGVAMAGMMAGSMGVLNGGTAKLISDLSMALFLMSTMVFAAKSIAVTLKLATVAQAAFTVVTETAAMGMEGLVVAGRLFGATLWAAMGPFALIGAAVAGIGWGIMSIKTHTQDLKKKWDNWNETIKNTGTQIGVSIEDAFRSASGTIDRTLKNAHDARDEAEKWAKENSTSQEIVAQAGNSAEGTKGANLEVLRIGVDIFQATHSAVKARQAMDLAIQGAHKEGIILKVTVDEKSIDKQMTEVTTGLVKKIADTSRSTSEKLKFWDTSNWGGHTSLDSSKDAQIGSEAKSRIDDVVKQIGSAYDQLDIHAFQVQSDAVNASLDKQAKTSETMGVKVHNIRVQAVDDLVKQKLVTRDAGVANDDLAYYLNKMRIEMQEDIDTEEAHAAAIAAGTEQAVISAEQLQKLGEVKNDILHSAWTDVMSEAARQADLQFQNSLNALDAAAKNKDNQRDVAAKKKNADFDKQSKAMTDRQEKEDAALKKSQKARKDADDKAYDAKIKQIDDQINAEEKAEAARQKIFEAEKTRIQRIADLYNQNVDLNVALKGGNMDEAAKISNNMYATIEANALDDAAAAGGETSDARTNALNTKKENLEAQKQAHDDYLSELDQSEQDALQKTQDRDKEALDLKKQNYSDEVTAAKARDADILASRKAAVTEEHRVRQESLDADLAAWESYIPTSEADLKKHVGVLEGVYAKHDITINTKSDQWSKSINSYIEKATNKARGELANDPEWTALGTKAGDAIMKAMLGMSLADFNGWALAGMPANKNGTPAIPSRDETAHPGGTKGWTIQHGGGPAGSSSGRAGRSMSSGLWDDEYPTILQRGEYVVDKKTANDYGPDFFNGLQNRRPETGDGPGVMAGAGAKVLGVAMGMFSKIAPLIASRRAAESSKNGRATPKQVLAFLAANSGSVPGAAGKYGDVDLNDSQLANASAIISTGRGMGATDRDIIIGLMTALQESSLNNIGYGDSAGPDSRGLFQQRDSWGDLATRMNPAGAARLFFQRELSVKNREKMPLTAVAQKVQVSAFPEAYAKWENEARAILAATSGAMVNISGTGGRGVNSTADIISLISGKGVPYRVTSTLRPGALTHASGSLSYHATGNAVDFGGVPAGRDNPSLLAINKLFARYGKGLNELIYSGPGGINLLNGSAHTFNPVTRADHHDHVHVAATKDSLAKLSMPSMRTGGFTLSDGYARLHKKEAVLTAPLTQALKDGINNIDSAGNNQYNITMDLRGSVIDSDFDFGDALEKAIQKREGTIGRVRKVGS